MSSKGIKKEFHGGARTRLYKIWVAMKQRCSNPKSQAYKYYGGKGIIVCDSWKASFAVFAKDMGQPPTDKHSIDRIDGSKGYEPDNCRWATRREQSGNTSRNRWLTHDGKTQLMEDWANELGIGSNTLIWRIRNWGEKEALTVKGPRSINAPRKGKRLITFNGQTKSLSDWARDIGVSTQALRIRLKLWTLEKSLTTPRTMSCVPKRFA